MKNKKPLIFLILILCGIVAFAGKVKATTFQESTSGSISGGPDVINGIVNVSVSNGPEAPAYFNQAKAAVTSCCGTERTSGVLCIDDKCTGFNFDGDGWWGNMVISGSGPTVSLNYVAYFIGSPGSYTAYSLWGDGDCNYPVKSNSGQCYTAISFVNLNFIVDNQIGQPIPGAFVSIDQDFGNGTARSTDGSGFANFGVYSKTSIGWSVSASSCSGSSGNANSGPNGTTVNVTLSCTIQCSGPSSQSCTSGSNACGQTSSGTQTRTCNTSNGSWSDWGSCSATTPPNPPGFGNSCTSSANACGQTNSGTIQCDGSCSASTPPLSSCPAPNSPSNVTETDPDYCVSGPAATVNWTYSDPSGSPQQSYQVQIDDQDPFASLEVDSGKVNSGSNSYFTGQGLLQFNTTYKARVRVWNSFDVVSNWTQTKSWKTPPYAYPQVDFNWTANGILNNPSPPLNKPVDFTDQTIFSDDKKIKNQKWDWLFGDGGSSTTQSPSHTYSAEGSYYVTLTATDNANQVCSRTKGPLIIQKPIPKWREIAPH